MITTHLHIHSPLINSDFLAKPLLAVVFCFNNIDVNPFLFICNDIFSRKFSLLFAHPKCSWLASSHFVFAHETADVAQIWLLHASYPNFHSKCRDTIFSKCQLRQVLPALSIFYFNGQLHVLFRYVFHVLTYIFIHNVENLRLNFCRLYPFVPLISLSSAHGFIIKHFL